VPNKRMHQTAYTALQPLVIQALAFRKLQFVPKLSWNESRQRAIQF